MRSRTRDQARRGPIADGTNGRDMRRLRAAASSGVLALALLAAGCGTPPPPPPPETRVDAAVMATVDVNPDFNGEPSPVFVRVYELRSTARFNAATFQGVFEKETETLGGDLVRRESVVLKPGDSQSVAMTFQPGSTSVGVVASFQDIDRSRWRATAAVAPDQTNPFTVTIGRDAVTVVPKRGGV